ncbi:hypothetical protein INR49_007175, partial [Caranx melampygus]
MIRRVFVMCRVMAGQRRNWGRLSLLVIFSLVISTEPFKVRDEDWEELGPDIAALHHLQGLAQHMFHERLKEPSNQSVDTDQNPMSLLDGFQECQDFTACVNQRQQDLDTFLASVDKQKIKDQLLGASEISHSYSQKLLVMVDNEKSTNDRVQQDYSMDPHYSVIVTKECLYNESCLPEVDSYTVVKIFGRVSDDGQTVSELSGSSLAELMLKVSLKAAPVFSIDGNTTTDFQHDFIRMFMVRGIRAVLETSQGNHQIYQAMDKPGSVSNYQIPQRPIDHTTQYDHQQILMMEDDPVVRKAATYLTRSIQQADCLQGDPFTKCIKSQTIDYSNSTNPLVVDLQEDKAFNSVTEVRGSEFNDVIKGNKEHNVFVPGRGDDFIQGRGGRNADAEGDMMKDVENVIGTIYSDILVSGYESSLLKGSDGNDILVSIGGDYLVGDSGNDIYMLAFHNGSVTIDNCAKDNATDVLYLSSKSSETYDCEVFSDRVLLTFFGLNQNTVKITLVGWIDDDSECGHLELVFREVKVSVHML